MENILESYLVRLGFQNDQPSFLKFQGMLHDAESTVDRHSSGIVKTLLKAQGGIIGAFASVSGAIIGMVDKVAMADQSYRLFGLRMLMTQDSARKMQLITQGLGASMEEIIWDPELHARAVTMAHDIDRMTQKLGPDFEKKMVAIRDMRAELSLLSLAGQFVGMNFVSSLFTKLGTDIPGVQAKLESFVNYAIENGPAIADKLATYAVPILRETWTVLLDIGEAGKQFAVTMTNIIGVLTGDESIQGTTLDLEKLTKALLHVADGAKIMLREFNMALQAELHFTKGMAALSAKQWTVAGQEFRAAVDPGYAAQLENEKLREKQWILSENNKHRQAERAGKEYHTPADQLSSKDGYIGAAKNSDPIEQGKEALGILESTIQSGIKGFDYSGASGMVDGIINGYQSASSLTDKLRKSRAMGRVSESIESPETLGSKPPSEDQTQGKISAATEFESRLADEIETFEGYYPKGTPGHKNGSISWRNNNPGNMRSDPATPGIVATGKNEGFLVFRSYDDGRNALLGDIHSKVEQGLNLQSFFEKYAPKSDKNNPAEYAETVARRLGIDTKKPLSDFTGADAGARAESQTAAISESAIQRMLRMNETELPVMVPGAPAKPDQMAHSAMPPREAIEASIAYTDRPLATPSSSTVTNHISVSVDVGGITIPQPDADAREIRRAVSDGVIHGLSQQTSLDLMQLQPAL